jgi:hypothetical protein
MDSRHAATDSIKNIGCSVGLGGVTKGSFYGLHLLKYFIVSLRSKSNPYQQLCCVLTTF